MIKTVIFVAIVLVAQSQTCTTSCPTGATINFVSEASTTLVTGPKTMVQAPAVLNIDIHTAWTATIPGASWISDEPKISANLAPLDTFRYYTRFINLPCSPTSAILRYASDNSVKTFINGQYVDACSSAAEKNFGASRSCDVKIHLTVGNNVISGAVRNWIQPRGSPESNPAGLMYRLDAVV